MKNKRESKRGQVTIFIILAILIVAVLVFAFFPIIKGIFIPQTPEQMIPKSCVESALRFSLNETIIRGGTLKPELYFKYQNLTIDYLCYTADWYKTCTMQRPLLKQQIEAQTIKSASSEIAKCFSDMENKLRSNGYAVVSKGNKTATLQLIPGKLKISNDIELSITKDGNTFTLDKNRFTMQFDSGVYELTMIASAIQNFEATYGDSVPETYMALYPNIKIEKLKQSDGTKLYILTDRTTFEKLQFAIRSLSWPPA